MNRFTYQQLTDSTCAVISCEGHDEKIVIPETFDGMTVVMLADDLFAGHAEISRIVLPKGLKYIGSNVFNGCKKLKSLRLPEGIENLAQYAFTGSGLEIIEIPGSVRNIIPYTFKACPDLNTAIIRLGVKKIYASAFEDCVNLELVAVPSDTEISHEAFTGCVKMNPNLTRKLVASCRCPACTGAAPKISYPGKDKVKAFLRNKRQP